MKRIHGSFVRSSREYAIANTWTDALPRIPHVQLFKNMDCPATALRPLDTWPDSLRHITFFHE